jgi:UDP-N-acetyl-D-mannosaminuronic acid transferase (WecB/TagA/CpsF family)
MAAQRDVNFYTILNRADLCLADGIGLLYAARLLGKRLPDRITGSDGLPKIAAWAAEEGWRRFPRCGGRRGAGGGRLQARSRRAVFGNLRGSPARKTKMLGT